MRKRGERESRAKRERQKERENQVERERRSPSPTMRLSTAPWEDELCWSLIQITVEPKRPSTPSPQTNSVS